MCDNNMRTYVSLIENYEKDRKEVDELIDENEDCGCDDEMEEGSMKHGHDEMDENKEADKRIKEVLSEDGDFWEHFEKDNDFDMEENNGMYCVKGADTGFHYGSHVDYDCAASHVESLRNYQ